jgi:hypothetical protein
MTVYPSTRNWHRHRNNRLGTDTVLLYEVAKMAYTRHNALGSDTSDSHLQGTAHSQQ